MVITPACDIERFWKRTRGILTLARLEPLDPSNIGVAFRHDFRVQHVVNSVTARTPIILPTLTTSNGMTLDYALFFHQIVALWLEPATPKDSDKAHPTTDRPLTYPELGNVVTRVCRLSEPFLSGVLSKIEAELFRVGVPDFPEAETRRIKKVLKGESDVT